MKEYLSSRMFSDPAFPLSVTRLLQRSQMVPHIHDFIELVLVASGHTIHKIGSPGGKLCSYGLISGDCFAILPGEIHSYTDSHNLILYNIAFQPELLRSELAELKNLPVWEKLFGTRNSPWEKQRIHLLPYERQQVEDAVKKMMLEISGLHAGWRFRVRIALLQMLCAIDRARDQDWRTHDVTPSSGVLKTLEYMEKNPVATFDLGQMAAMAGMSVSSYTRKFRLMVGDSPREYFLGIRLDRICNELVHGDDPIAELAYRYGFCDSTYMIRQFRRRYGIPPSQYRRLATGEKIRSAADPFHSGK